MVERWVVGSETMKWSRQKTQRTYMVDALLLTIRPPFIPPYVAVGDGEG